jgi:hypothetical protein
MELLCDRYQIQAQLGKKAGRKTFLAQDLETQAQVVVKCLTFGHDFEWDDLKLFEREAETLKSLHHPAIPEYLDFFELDLPHGKGFALVQSYIPAKSLEQHLKAGRSFTETEVKQLSEQLLDIMIYLHNQQPSVIHRDIKPSNILLSDRSGNHVGNVYLVDFGSVQTLLSQEGGTITVVGTYGYMPPEQYGGRATPASDLYSLGTTLIYLVTGRHPADLPQRNLKLQFRALTTVSETLTDWLEWLTEPDTGERLASAEAALAALQAELRSPASLQPLEASPRISLDQLFWNATWRMGSLGAGLGLLIALLITAASRPSPFWTVLVGSVYTLGALGLGLGFVNGLVMALLTKLRFAPLRNPWRYRLAMLSAATGFSLILFSAMLYVGLFTYTFGLFYASLLMAVLVCFGMGVTSQWFAEWYIRVSRNRPLQRSPQPTIIHSTTAASLAHEQVFWNAIWRNCVITTPLGGALTISAAYAYLSRSFVSNQVALGLLFWGVQGASLFCAIAVLNGITLGFISARFLPNPKHRWRYRLILLLCTTAITTSCVYLIGALLSALWINLPLAILLADAIAAVAGQFFANWYLRETCDRRS